MSRHRDYQPTIDRAHGQIEVFRRRESKLREKKDECHREMLRAQAAARIANEEADALRDRITGLEQSVRDLRTENRRISADRGNLIRAVTEANARLEEAQRSTWQRLKAWAGERWREMLTKAVEA